MFFPNDTFEDVVFNIVMTILSLLIIVFVFVFIFSIVWTIYVASVINFRPLNAKEKRIQKLFSFV